MPDLGSGNHCRYACLLPLLNATYVDGFVNTLTSLALQTIVMFVPRKSFVCDKILEEEGVYGHVILEDLKLDLIPFDEDIISMEVPLFFK